MYPIYQWNNKSELKQLESYQYWNNEAEEKKKEWDIRDGNFKKLNQYLWHSGLKRDLIKAIQLSGLRSKTKLRGIELGGGVCWSAPVLFNYLNILEMQFLEFSEHRITKIAPLILEHYRIPEDKVKLILGSFYEIKCPDESMDFIVLSQAFHHAANVECLLAEMNRVLKKEGVVIIIGEHNRGTKFVFHCMAQRIWDILCGEYHSEHIELYKQSGCLGVDKRLGDRYYSVWSYAKMFRKYQFECKRIRTSKEEHFGFILRKKDRI